MDRKIATKKIFSPAHSIEFLAIVPFFGLDFLAFFLLDFLAFVC